MEKQQASLLMMCAAVMWGTNPALIQLAQWQPLGTAWLRAGFCAVLLFAYVILGRRWRLSDFTNQFFCGLFLAVNSLLFVGASTYTAPANAVVLMFTFPWITIGLDMLFRQARPTRGDLARLLLGLGGIVLIVNEGLATPNAFGDLLALCAGVAIALHIFFCQNLGQKFQGNRELLTAILLSWAFSFVLLAPLVVFNTALPTAMPSIPWPTANQWGYLIPFGVLSALPWFLWSKSVAHISGHVIAALLGIEVFTAALLGWLLLDDIPRMGTWIGGCMTLLAAGWQILAAQKVNA